MVIEENIEEIEVEKGIGIWGNTECVQCGACCYEFVRYFHRTEVGKIRECENFVIQNSRVYCLAHNNTRKPLCKNYFCGNTDFNLRFQSGRDETLRKIAKMIGTAPQNYKVPKLLLKI